MEFVKEFAIFLHQNDIIKFGDFTLASGKKSSYYIDLRLVASFPHIFRKMKNGVEIKDRIMYSVPFGFIGRILNKLWIKKDLENIFSYREKVIKDLFSTEHYKAYT